ncbi:MAG TPA: hypothetical protein VNT51_12910 [Miltoncostaeaceae bacterium]|nr:hypothetical protein [Miltoncostaeaceae bacterium]
MYARLAHEAEERTHELVSPRWARPVGWLIVVLIVVVVVLAAAGVEIGL